MNKPTTNLAIAIAALILWIGLTFGLTLETGWVHIPLGVAAIFIARAVIVSDPASEE